MTNACSICGAAFSMKDHALTYPGIVCESCEARATGANGEPFDENAPPETPWLVDGHRCWYRGRGQGAGMMFRDYAGVGDFWSFERKCVSGDWGRDLYSAATGALAAQGKAIAAAFGDNVSKAYVGTELPWDGETWAVCRARQDASSARMLDTAMAWRAKVGARRGVAVVLPPEKPGKYGAADASFVAQYQAAVWEAFGVAFFVDANHGDPSAATPSWRLRPAPPRHADFLDEVAGKIRERLTREAIPEGFLLESRDAEAVVRPVVHRVLYGLGFRRVRSAFRSMWRHPATDGTWENERHACRRIALEVKYEEDVEAPLCQAIDYLGSHDAVLQVRLVSGKTREAMARLPAAAREAVDAAARRLPVRWIEMAV